MSYLKLSLIRRLSVFILLFTAQLSIAQPTGFTVVKNTGELKNALAESNNAIQTLICDFTQVKNMALLKERIRSKGQFFFKKEDKVRIEYTHPYTYLMVMNGSQMMIRDEQKTSKINTGNSKILQSVNRIMVDCMRGTMFQNTDFKVNAFENNTDYLLQLSPVNAAMKKMFSSINVYLSKKTMDVIQLVMTEQGGDNTTMSFSNIRRNTTVNEQLFKTK